MYLESERIIVFLVKWYFGRIIVLCGGFMYWKKYKKILWSLLMKLKVPNEEASNIIGEIGGHGMGYLFENMDEIDIGALKRNTAREKQRADEEKQRADEEKQRANEEKQRADEEKQLRIEAEKRVADERKQRKTLEDEVARLKKLLEIQEKK